MQPKQGLKREVDEQRFSDNYSDVHSEQWTVRSIFLSAFLLRLLLVFYGRIHDYLFKVDFTDVDYKVFTDSARYVYEGKSPFFRSTYRYSPFLAWILIPNNFWPEFGKLLFCALDILVGWLYFKLGIAEVAVKEQQWNLTSKITKVKDFGRSYKALLWIWLFNPLTAVISARGNADVLICLSVISSLYLIRKKKLFVAAILYGLAVHLKLYPIIYLPSIFLYLSQANRHQSFMDFIKKQLFNFEGFVFLLTSFAVVLCIFAIFYNLYGDTYLSEAILYHIGRTDTRHNFSPYFYILYLSDGTSTSDLVGIGAFLPQAVLIIYFSFRYHDDLPFCWLLTTIAFVALNKVCTSQYFLWYICLIPAQNNLRLGRGLATIIVLLWVLSQGVWLLPAYLFEFQGLNTFIWMWLGSLLFLIVNSSIIVLLCRNYSAFTASFKNQQSMKKWQ